MILSKFNFFLYFLISLFFYQTLHCKVPITVGKTARSVIESVSAESLFKDLRSFVKESRPNRIIGSPGHQKAQSLIETKVRQLAQGSGPNQVKIFTDLFKLKKDRAIQFLDEDFKNKVETKLSKTDTRYQQLKNLTESYKVFIQKKANSNLKNFFVYLGPKEVAQSDEEIDRPWVLVEAHYDNIGLNRENLTIVEDGNFPGADHNGTGVVLLLSLMTVLNSIPLKHPVVFALTDSQGAAFEGSKQLVESLQSGLVEKNFGLKLNLLQLTLTLEMLGYDSKSQDKESKYGNFKVYAEATTASSEPHFIAAKKGFNNLKKQVIAKSKPSIDFKWTPSGFDNCNGAILWAKKIPSVCLSHNWESDSNEKRWMSPEDVPEFLRQETFYQVYRFLAYGLVHFSYTDG